MNILLLTLGKIRGLGEGDIYSDLVEEFIERGQDLYVLSPVEKKEKRILLSKDIGHFHLHPVNIGNYFNTPWLEKGVTTVFLSQQYINVIKTQLDGISFDLLLYSTPPVTFASVIKYVKKKYPKCISYLMLKDIWPQAMADMGTLNNRGLSRLPYAYFEQQEKQIYRISDYIGCMSPANERYLYRHNRYLDKNRIELCPNAVKVKPEDEVLLSDDEKRQIRKKNNLPTDKTIFVFGGNIGNGHDPDFIIECLKRHEKRNDSFVLFVGKGVYYERLKLAFEKNGFQNARLIPYLPYDEYIDLIKACDVGLIFLDYRFTIPNFPSKLMSYVRIKMPVLIACDTATDIGIIAERGGFGYWCESNNADKVIGLMDKFMDSDKRKEMGEKGFCFMEKHYSTDFVYKQIMKHFPKEAE